MPKQKRQHLRDLLALLMRSPDGLSTPEIGQHLGVTRQTALTYITALEEDGIPIFEENKRYFIHPDYDYRIHLSLAQAWFMYLPLRRIVRAELHRFPLVRSLLRRVAALFDPEIADQLVPDPLEEDSTNRDQIFLDLVMCWRKRCHIELRYKRPNADHATQLVVAPWWFEPAAWSDAFYVIGGLRKKDGSHTPITLKLDRIQSAHPLDTNFERPSGHEITAQLEKTWGIWVGDDAPVLVRLRFHNRQHQRLQETRWHPTQEVLIDVDGSVIWQARISEPQEMVPWIRGWGADVEVLEPLELREQIAAEAAATARLYQEGAENDENHVF